MYEEVWILVLLEMSGVHTYMCAISYPCVCNYPTQSLNYLGPDDTDRVAVTVFFFFYIHSKSDPPMIGFCKFQPSFNIPILSPVEVGWFRSLRGRDTHTYGYQNIIQTPTRRGPSNIEGGPR